MNEKLKMTVTILKQWENKSKRILTNGTLQICHVPHIGSDAWLHELYAGLTNNQISELQATIPMPLPNNLKEFYKIYNGINIFSDSMNVHGLRSLNYRMGEEAIQPYSLYELNLIRPEIFQDEWLYIGSYSWDGSKVAIDLNCNKIYRCNRDDDKILNEWPDFWSWLLNETERLSKMFDENGVELDEDDPTTP